MRNEGRTPRLGMIVALGAAIAAIWMVALYGTYEDAKKEKYDVGVRPGAVTYGTHSSVVVPMVSSPMHSTSAPMISGGAVRSYAYQGHATMPSTATGSGFKLHTTSSATVHTIGSGGGSNNLSPITNNQSVSSSSRGITYGGTSVSMPTFALVTPTYATTASELSQPAQRSVGPKRTPGITGSEYEGQTAIDGGKMYYWDGEAWIEVVGSNSEGDTQVIDGITYTYHVGVGWVADQSEAGEGLPLGATPWFLMLFLAIGYGVIKMARRKFIHG